MHCLRRDIRSFDRRLSMENNIRHQNTVPVVPAGRQPGKSALAAWKRGRKATEIQKGDAASRGLKSQVIVVALNAAKRVTKHALEWTLTNVAQAGNRITVLAVIPFYSAIWYRLLSSWLGIDFRQICKLKKGDSESVITNSCVDMLRQLNDRCVEKKVQVDVQILVLKGRTSVVAEARKLNASWLILDRGMKKQERSCAAQLQCNLVIVNNSQHAKFLKLHLKRDVPQDRDSEDGDSSSGLLPGLSFTNLPAGFDGIVSTINPIFVRSRSRRGPPTSPAEVHDDSTSECTITSSPVFTRVHDDSTSECTMESSPVFTTSDAGTLSSSTTSFARQPSDSRSYVEALMSTPAGSRLCVDGDFRADTANGTGTTAEMQIVPASSQSSLDISPNRRDSKLSGQILDDGYMPSAISSEMSAKGSLDFSIPGRRTDEFLERECGGAEVPCVASISSNLSLATEDNDSPLSSRRTKVSAVIRRPCKTSVEVPEDLAGDGILDGELDFGISSTLKGTSRSDGGRRSAIGTIEMNANAPPLCSICKHKAPVFGRPAISFSYAELSAATDGFSKETFLAEGGFGSVHKGVLPDGQVIAVKQRRAVSSQGEKEFRSEVEVLSCAQHRNVVMLIGYCIETGHRLLVYEFVCYGSLSSHLFGTDRPALEWAPRQTVALGAARGLRFLHEDCRVGCIVHRDLRPSNILVTHDFEPLVGDFGLARCQQYGDLEEETRVLGTFGYLAPEYVQTGHLTEKADVFSFGVILLELVTGRKAIDYHRPRGQQCLTEWARPLLEDHSVGELIDPRLEDRYSEYEAFSMLHVASLCLRRDPHSRPRMSQVLTMLEGDLLGHSAASLFSGGRIPRSESENDTKSYQTNKSREGRPLLLGANSRSEPEMPMSSLASPLLSTEVGNWTTSFSNTVRGSSANFDPAGISLRSTAQPNDTDLSRRSLSYRWPASRANRRRAHQHSESFTSLNDERASKEGTGVAVDRFWSPSMTTGLRSKPSLQGADSSMASLTSDEELSFGWREYRKLSITALQATYRARESRNLSR